tara:strand:- start:119 stop:592 length:474 start_codon:yes stop_codon:yes gene_type:complete
MIIPFQMSPGGATSDTMVEFNLGSGTNPATTYDVSAFNTNIVVNSFWYIPDAITITAVHVMAGGDVASTANDINFHLMKFDMDTTTNYGDLSNGVVVADQGASGVISDVNQAVVKHASLTVDTSNNNVSAGQVVLCTYEATGTDEISCVVTVKYNIR